MTKKSVSGAINPTPGKPNFENFGKGRSTGGEQYYSPSEFD